MNIKSEYIERVSAIRDKYLNLEIFSEPEKEYRKHFLLPESVLENSLLFIGINPSFTKGSCIPKDEENIHFYQTEINKNDKDIPYFEKIRSVAKYCGIDWTHLDLFFIRETNQKLIEELTYNKLGIDFLNAQLEISFEIIEKSQPKLIIVANALASEFFGKKKENKHRNIDGPIWRGFDLFFDENKSGNKSTFNSEIGTYEIKLNNSIVPIIFSGMLSGQRALDIGSLERLKWQAKMILAKNKSNN